MSKRFLSALNPFRGRRPARPQPRTLLRVEGMEDRTVPTVVFTPKYGAPTVNSFSPSAAIQSPQVNLLFVGSYWGTTTGASDAGKITQDVKTILGGPYLSKLTQYGSDGKATFGVEAVNTNAFPGGGAATFNLSTMSTAVGQQFFAATGALPGPWTTTRPNIYVVVTDPNAVAWNSSYLGYNWTGNYTPPGTLFNFSMNMIWVSAALSGGSVNRDGVSVTLSHELAEKIASNVSLTPPTGIAANMIAPGTGRQICDLETDGGNYTYRTGGVLVQSYWSKVDGGYVVPDYHPETAIDLSPIWPALDAAGNATFTGQYALVVNGDQGGANAADRIDLRAGYYAGRGTSVTLNGEEAIFDPGVIRNVQVNALGGNNTVQVEGVESGVTVNVINSSTTSNDTVTVGNYWGSLVGIAGTVNVSNGSGHTKLVVDDSGDGSFRYATVTSSSVQVGSALVNYTAGSSVGVNVVDLELGRGGNSVYVSSTSPAAPVWIFAHNGDSRSGPAAGQVNWINVDLLYSSIYGW
jgi:hypothetical protein